MDIKRARIWVGDQPPTNSDLKKPLDDYCLWFDSANHVWKYLTNTIPEVWDVLESAAGSTGAPGPTGPQGEAGPQGPQGIPGTNGIAGATGSQGVQGPTGSTGPQGIQGIQGTQGLQGVPGTTTWAGITGIPAAFTPGYLTGSGGTVTQLTSKATGVTLNTRTGQITMQGAALAAGAIVTFLLTNSTIAATDLLVLNHVTTGTRGAYSLEAQCNAGSANIYIRNNTAAALSEAIVIRFALIKGVTS